MASALLVSEQHAHLDVAAGWDETVPQDARRMSGLFYSGEWSVEPSSSSTSSPFDYQRAIIHAVWLPAAKSNSSQRHNPRNAQLALEQIRALHRKQESRRREHAEAEWIAANRRLYAGRWVALLGGELIAAGDSAKAVAQAAAGAPSTPLIIYLENDLPFAGW